jgi:hypothetical protein
MLWGGYIKKGDGVDIPDIFVSAADDNILPENCRWCQIPVCLIIYYKYHIPIK